MARPRDHHAGYAAQVEDLLIAPARVQAVYVAVRLRIPDLLSHGPLSSTVLASTTGVHPGALHRLLRFLAAQGFFDPTEDGRFALAPLAEPLLRSAANEVREALLSTATREWELWAHLLESVETGRSACELVFGDGVLTGTRAKLQTAFGPDAAAIGRALAALIEPAPCIAGLGCGDGALVIELLRAWPATRAIGVDAAPALEGTCIRREQAGLESRFELCAGDLQESAPAGASLYVLSLILRDRDDGQCMALLRNCQAAMAPGARMVIIEQPLPDDPRTAPRSAFADLEMLVMTGGRERTEAEYRNLLERAGLRVDAVRPLPAGDRAVAIEASRGLV